ncbi:hypothetical protein HZS_2161 [Henneguya salminicola]|nr:hypothetical protein HZS_2161 [Henneguya salminicola]
MIEIDKYKKIFENLENFYNNVVNSRLAFVNSEKKAQEVDYPETNKKCDNIDNIISEIQSIASKINHYRKITGLNISKVAVFPLSNSDKLWKLCEKFNSTGDIQEFLEDLHICSQYFVYFSNLLFLNKKEVWLRITNLRSRGASHHPWRHLPDKNWRWFL